MAKVKTIPHHFTLELEGLSDQGDVNGWKNYTKFYTTLPIHVYIYFNWTNYLREVDPTQNMETNTLKNLTTFNSLYLIEYKRTHMD